MHRYRPIPAALFEKKRAALTSKMQPGSIAIFHSNACMPRNGDQCYPFRQNSDFFMLCGIDRQPAALILFPDAPKPEWKEVLFIPYTDEHMRIWEGESYTPQQATEISAIQHVEFYDQFKPLLQQMLYHAEHIYLYTDEQLKFQPSVPTPHHQLIDYIRQHYPTHHVLRIHPLLRSLRMIKLPEEVDLINTACAITRDTFVETLPHIRPGVFEYEIEAHILSGFLRRGANGHAFYPIVASGHNSCVLHYTDNAQQCEDGDILLLDFGAEYANYAADITRCVPVNGTFSPRQRQVYEAVLRILRQATQLLRPGITLSDYEKRVGSLVERELLQLGLLTQQDIDNQDPKKPAYKKYFMHGTSHHLGLDVHDTADREQPLQPGMVLTCEPAIYIREENLGIRLENDILITEDEPINLTADIPIEIDEIEALLQAK